MTRISALCLLSSTLVALSLFAVGASAFTLTPKTTVSNLPQPKVYKEGVTAFKPPKVPAVQNNHKGTGTRQ